MNEAPLALVSGATGYIGGRLIPALLSAGYRVRAMARHPDRLDGRAWRDAIGFVAADALDHDDLSRAMEGVDVSRGAVRRRPCPSR